VPFLTLPLGFRVVFEKPTFVTCYDPIKKIWSSMLTVLFDALFDRHSNFLNNLCTHLSHIQILYNNLVDLTFINIEFIGDHSN
jgi:hypothetical protein